MRAIRRDILWTMLCQVIVVAGVFVQYWLVRTNWGIEAFGAYSQVVRVRGAIEWIVLLQLPLAMARLIATARSPRDQFVLGATGLCMGLALVAAVSSALLAAPGFAAASLLGNGGWSPWIAPLCALLLGYSAVLLSTGMLRGLMSFPAANAMSVISTALVPCGVLSLTDSLDATAAVTASGLSAALATAMGLVWLYRQRAPAARIDPSAPVTAGEATQCAGQLMRYGAPRVTTLFFNALFLVCLPWLAASDSPGEFLASLNTVLALLGGAAILTAPMGFVLLPLFSREIAGGNTAEAAQHLRTLVSGTIAIGILASFLFLGLAEYVLSVLLGDAGVTPDVLLIAGAITVPLFLLVDVLRGPMDAVSSAPLNALVYLAGFAAMLTTFALASLDATIPIAWRCALALPAGYAAAALASCLLAAMRYRLRLVSTHDAAIAAVWLVVLGLAALLGRALAAGAGTALFLGYILILRPDWFRHLRPERSE